MLDEALFQRDRLTQADVAAFVTRYRRNPVLFASEVLGMELDGNQQRIAEAVLNHNYIAVVSGRGIGKSILDGCLALWFWSVFPGAEVRLLSNTDGQSKRTLWSPLVRILRQSCIRSWSTAPTSESIYFAGDKMGHSIQRVVWSPTSIESVSGEHSEHLLYILDEASKFPNDLIDSIVAGLTQTGNKILMTSNGTRSSGYFYNACNDPDMWTVLHIDSRTSKWADKDRIARIVQEHGIDSDVFRVHVLGEFPSMSSSSIISDSAILDALRRRVIPLENHAVICGMDVGGGGDSTVWAIRKGLKLLAMVSDTSSGSDLDLLIQKTMLVCQQYKVQRLVVDATGFGYFTPIRLRKALPNVEVVGQNFAAKSPRPGYENVRTWMYFRLREWFDLGPDISGVPRTQDLREELLATEYQTNIKGNLALIPKTSIRAALDRSPDSADALALSCGYLGDLCGMGVLAGSYEALDASVIERGGRWADPLDRRVECLTEDGDWAV